MLLNWDLKKKEVARNTKINNDNDTELISFNYFNFLWKRKSISTPEKLFEISLPFKSTNKD